MTRSLMSITPCISDIRHAIGDDAQRILKTVLRRGYLFAAQVHTQRYPQQTDAGMGAQRTLVPFRRTDCSPLKPVTWRASLNSRNIKREKARSPPHKARACPCQQHAMPPSAPEISWSFISNGQRAEQFAKHAIADGNPARCAAANAAPHLSMRSATFRLGSIALCHH
jgi:hypothetical protein